MSKRGNVDAALGGQLDDWLAALRWMWDYKPREAAAVILDRTGIAVTPGTVRRWWSTLERPDPRVLLETARRLTPGGAQPLRLIRDC